MVSSNPVHPSCSLSKTPRDVMPEQHPSRLPPAHKREVTTTLPVTASCVVTELGSSLFVAGVILGGPERPHHVDDHKPHPDQPHAGHEPLPRVWLQQLPLHAGADRHLPAPGAVPRCLAPRRHRPAQPSASVSCVCGLFVRGGGGVEGVGGQEGGVVSFFFFFKLWVEGVGGQEGKVVSLFFFFFVFFFFFFFFYSSLWLKPWGAPNVALTSWIGWRWGVGGVNYMLALTGISRLRALFAM